MNFNEFVRKFRRFEEGDLVNIGLSAVWHAYKNPASYSQNDRQLNTGIVPRLILLSLTHSNDPRLKQQKPDLIKLISSYNDIEKPKINPQDIVNCVEALSQDGNNDDQNNVKELKNYLMNNPLQEACNDIGEIHFSNLIVGRDLIGLGRLYTSWKIFKVIADKNKKIDFNMNKILGISPIVFFKVCHALFSFARQKNGYINFREVVYDEDFCKEWDVYPDDLHIIADRLSLNVEGLKSEWHQIEKLSDSYQSYFHNPLTQHPLIKLEESTFLMPDPISFLYATSKYLFLELEENKEAMLYSPSDLGDFIADHIVEALQYIFGQNKVHRIGNEELKHADVIIELKQCILVIEIKKQIASYRMQSTMQPQDIAVMWRDTYGALKQLSKTVNEERKNTDKTIIPIVLYYDFIGMCLEPFKILAKESNMLTDLGLQHILLFSWPIFEDWMRRYALSDFEKELIHMYENPHYREDYRSYLEDGSASNNLQYLEASKREISP